MTIGDRSTSGMYNAHILSQIAGTEGTVYAIVGLSDTEREGSLERVQETLDRRNVDGVLSNVELVGTLEDLPENSIDVLITVRNYHDFGERADRVANVLRMLRVLKPGGILGAIDAYTDKTDERERRDKSHCLEHRACAQRVGSRVSHALGALLDRGRSRSNVPGGDHAGGDQGRGGRGLRCTIRAGVHLA